MSPEERLSKASLALQTVSDTGAEVGGKLPHSEALPVQAPRQGVSLDSHLAAHSVCLSLWDVDDGPAAV